MADEDPFAEPDDTEKTVIRPNPGGRYPLPSAATPVASPTPQPSAPAAPAPQPDRPATAPAREAPADALTGMNALVSCASTLFSLVGRIRNRAQHPDPDALRRSVVAEIRAFESRAIQGSLDPQHAKIARYAICATLDDVVLNTPWGGTSVWAQQSMVGTFHRETVGGDRFYDLLSRLEQDPARNIDLLEFLYMCLSLGFEGRLRIDKNGQERHQSIRHGLAQLIRAQRGEVEHDLSPHWEGVKKPHRKLSPWRPVWVAVAVSAFLMTATFMALSWTLSNETGEVVGQLSVLEPSSKAVLERRAPPVIPPFPLPEEDAELKKVSGFLTEEIEEGLVTVFQDSNTITVRINGSGMFASASDKLKPAFEIPLKRVAQALNETVGPVLVVGHADSSPIRSARFASNMELSLARAKAVRKKVATHVKAPDRMRAEGRSDQEPIASNDTRKGRAQNRRIEIVLIRESGK
jgi:type VI secretion system protein ImpK